MCRCDINDTAPDKDNEAEEGAGAHDVKYSCKSNLIGEFCLSAN